MSAPELDLAVSACRALRFSRRLAKVNGCGAHARDDRAEIAATSRDGASGKTLKVSLATQAKRAFRVRRCRPATVQAWLKPFVASKAIPVEAAIVLIFA
jgi:hypothetical protein